MKKFYNPDDYFLTQDTLTNEIYAILTIYRVKFRAAQNGVFFTCYHFSALGLLVNEVPNILPRERLELYVEDRVPVEV